MIILNGAPRSGKTSIALALRETIPGHWFNLGVDSARAAEARRYQPIAADGAAADAIARWQAQVHGDWDYDLEVDTSVLGPTECAQEIGARLHDPQTMTALAKLGVPRLSS